ncbi:hypothetical protein OIDMADRAFT_21141 [Oidiodendron maius Zn]|uniref:Uncharacterized protein n=1 Tax=Oidiodendron maius (strain Zn) TaxID=913774 RepID=A0A0C3D0H3_OIDMZ|nr:hypothetical protein OIDMADRAFT_21141 [Oidiodendron maius Zn]
MSMLLIILTRHWIVAATTFFDQAQSIKTSSPRERSGFPIRDVKPLFRKRDKQNGV